MINHPQKIMLPNPALPWAIRLVMVFMFCEFGYAEGPDTTWVFNSPRSEISPKYWISEDIRYDNEPALALAGSGRDYVNGCWSRTFAVDPGRFYRFQSYFQYKNVEEPNRSILARVLWQDKNARRLGRAEYPAMTEEQTPEGWRLMQQTYSVPEGAVNAEIELVYRWDADGQVFFSGTSLQQTPEVKPRNVRLAAIHHRPRNTKSASENLNQFAEFIQIAAGQDADIVCLPEGITVVGTGKTYVDVSETVPGPSTRFLGEVARKNGVYIVAGIYERDGPAVYNTAVLLDRDGGLAGKYRKVCLPREEIQGGITPGDAFPVFDTDFGRIGMMICWDVAFPEPARMLAWQGAEVILMPIWGGNLTLARARAIENQVFLVSSTYDMKTGVFDQEGDLMVEGTEQNPVAVVEIDLNKQKLWPWLGDYKSRIPRELPTKKAIHY